MSQRNRIVLAALALVAALALITPAPSHAAGLQSWRLPAVDALGRAWSWMAGLLPGGASRKPAARPEKEGGAINPNGGTPSGLTLSTPPTTSSGGDGTK